MQLSPTAIELTRLIGSKELGFGHLIDIVEYGESLSTTLNTILPLLLMINILFLLVFFASIWFGTWLQNLQLWYMPNWKKNAYTLVYVANLFICIYSLMLSLWL